MDFIEKSWADWMQNSAGPTFPHQVVGLLAYGIPTSQLVYGTVSLVSFTCLFPLFLNS